MPAPQIAEEEKQAALQRADPSFLCKMSERNVPELYQALLAHASFPRGASLLAQARDKEKVRSDVESGLGIDPDAGSPQGLCSQIWWPYGLQAVSQGRFTKRPRPPQRHPARQGSLLLTNTMTSDRLGKQPITSLKTSNAPAWPWSVTAWEHWKRTYYSRRSACISSIAKGRQTPLTAGSARRLAHCSSLQPSWRKSSKQAIGSNQLMKSNWHRSPSWQTQGTVNWSQ